MRKKLRALAKAGAVDLKSLSKEEKDNLENLLTDADVESLTNLNKRMKDDATLGPLGAACTRHGAD